MEWILGLLKYIIREYLFKVPSLKFRLFLLRRLICKLGDNTFIAMGLEIMGRGGKIYIGKNCIINPKVTLDSRGGSIIIGDNVDIGQNTTVWTLEHDPNSDTHDVKGGNVIIEDYVWIATKVTILPGITIGKGAVVGTGSVVTKDVPELAIVAGVPAKVIGKRKNRLVYELNYKPYFI